MFKKPLSDLKTSAPLRSSDRRKLRIRIIQSFSLPPEELDATGVNVADVLVPEGIRSVKFSTHLGDSGVLYTSPPGDPLWFTLGKGSDDFIPTVYTLWKRSTLLPHVSTSAEVIPKLIRGADLMIPGVIHHAPNLHLDQLVSITQHDSSEAKVNPPPLAVGMMAVDGDGMDNTGKGKAVKVLHTWKDAMWQLGNGGDFPEPIVSFDDEVDRQSTGEDVKEEDLTEDAPKTPPNRTDSPIKAPVLSTQEVTSLLRTSLVQAISSTLSALPPSSFPIPSTTLYSNHILPSRPSTTTSSTPIDIKNSTHKSLTSFLKSCEKEGLLKLKDMKGPSGLVITAVIPSHPDVQTHQRYTTMKDAEKKREREAERQRSEEASGKDDIVLREMWKPWGGSIAFFEELGKSKTSLYTQNDLKTLLNEYITEKNLVNVHQRAYINVSTDPALHTLLTSKKDDGILEFMKREELIGKVIEKMQAWYEIIPVGGESIVKKGQLKPISVITKVRQGRKASTIITNFEPFLLNAEELADELRKICASATSVSPIVGKSSGMEVLVQGRHGKAVSDLLLSKGMPKKWIEVVDLGGKKK